MLTERQRDEFERLGVVRVPGLLDVADAARMRDLVWHALAAEHGVRRDDPTTWALEQPTGFQALARAGAFDALGGPALTRAVDDLLGDGGWERPKQWGSPIIRFPARATPWNVPSAQWHLDFPARGAARPLFGIRILVLLDAVEPRAGGTLVLTGSHRLVERYAATGAPGGDHSRDVRRALARRDGWLKDLWSRAADEDRAARFMGEGTVIDGVAVSVRELCGAAGDGFLMHPWQLHAPAPNCGTAPRLLVSHSVMRIGWAPA